MCLIFALLIIFIALIPQTFCLLTEFCLLHERGIGMLFKIKHCVVNNIFWSNDNNISIFYCSNRTMNIRWQLLYGLMYLSIFCLRSIMCNEIITTYVFCIWCQKEMKKWMQTIYFASSCIKLYLISKYLESMLKYIWTDYRLKHNHSKIQIMFNNKPLNIQTFCNTRPWQIILKR